MMRKVMRCNSCGKATMCVSPDNFRFFCNRCLGNVRRQESYVFQQPQREPQPAAQQQVVAEQQQPTETKATRKGSKKEA